MRSVVRAVSVHRNARTHILAAVRLFTCQRAYDFSSVDDDFRRQPRATARAPRIVRVGRRNNTRRTSPVNGSRENSAARCRRSQSFTSSGLTTGSGCALHRLQVELLLRVATDSFASFRAAVQGTAADATCWHVFPTDARDYAPSRAGCQPRRVVFSNIRRADLNSTSRVRAGSRLSESPRRILCPFWRGTGTRACAPLVAIIASPLGGYEPDG